MRAARRAARAQLRSRSASADDAAPDVKRARRHAAAADEAPREEAPKDAPASAEPALTSPEPQPRPDTGGGAAAAAAAAAAETEAEAEAEADLQCAEGDADAQDEKTQHHADSSEATHRGEPPARAAGKHQDATAPATACEVPRFIAPMGPVLAQPRVDEEIVEIMHRKEADYKPASFFLQRQADIDAGMRPVLIDWMCEVCSEFCLGRETFHFAVNYVDRFLSAVPDLPRSKLQLLGVTSLFIAAKIEEIYPPKASDFAITTDGAYSAAEIYEMERRVLATLSWRLLPGTAHAFFRAFIKRAVCVVGATPCKDDPASKAQKLQLMERLLETTTFCRGMDLLDAMLLDAESHRYQPSAIAAAALSIVVQDVHFVIKAITGYERRALLPLFARMQPFLSLPVRMPQPAQPNYLEVRVAPEELHSRQTHSPRTLQLFRSICGRP